MLKSKVFFASSKEATTKEKNLILKLGLICDKLGFKDLFKKKDLVAIKTHFGEPGNTAFVNPVFVRKIVDKLYDLETNPFLTDTNTLYRGGRENTVFHLKTAIEHGFSYSAVKAPIVIADGLTGKSCVKVKIDFDHLKEARIASDFYHADACISISHFHGHPVTGFGGTLKNMGMGLANRSGKQVIHSQGTPKVNPKKCVGCEVCYKECPADAIIMENKKAKIVKDKCWGCGECVAVCPQHAIGILWYDSYKKAQERVAEYFFAATKNKKGKVCFFNFLLNVSPMCNCCAWTSTPIVTDIGILASVDPVALDQASVDMVNKQEGVKESSLKKNYKPGEDKFKGLFPEINWEDGLNYAEKIELGKRDYTIEEV